LTYLLHIFLNFSSFFTNKAFVVTKNHLDQKEENREMANNEIIVKFWYKFG